ncbi:hyaluronan-binding protein 2-like [Parambassis ranga]|uniref:trypsin n=1 Tax=Parambassis ranga TaxID=210632 RepID=A0A6P7JNF9_9TELE|nr:hyaluronan-binding protein 2-like [Parambassis ranga]
MNLQLLFLCLFLAVLIIPAELKREKHKDRESHHKHGMRGRKRPKFKDIIEDIFFGDDDDEDDDQGVLDWIFDLQSPEGRCDPNPCLNNGVCREKGKRRFKCDCPRPFRGKTCERGPSVCRRGRCGRGECVLTSTPPFYECKCKAPFQPPDCTTVSTCVPNPCRNGGTCVKDGNDFDCTCPPDFRGRFCRVGPGDCYVGDGESYRGNVSETDDGDECLHWNSHFILEQGADPYSSFEDKNGLGHHNFCRNPDRDIKPWCFFRRGLKLFWDYCDVTLCPRPPGVTPSQVVPTKPQPTSAKPIPTTRAPTTTQAPQPSPSPSPSDGPALPTTIPTTLPQDFDTCGKPQPKRAITRIFGGLKVSPGAIPWQVSIQVKPKGSTGPFKHICGGVLIQGCWVLTAGHCIQKNMNMQVVMGSLALSNVESSTQTIEVERAIVHENYRETPTAVYNDIALLKLRNTNGRCANETQFVKTACLPEGQLPDGMECKISGWGATEESDYGTNHLLEANVLLISQEKCSEPVVYGRAVDNTMFCAGHLQGGVDSCQGDSGGPLTCQQNSTHVIYGLVSWGDQCGKKNKPGVYTRVTRFLDWIKATIQANP